MKEVLLLGFLVTGFVALNMFFMALRGAQLRRQEEERGSPHSR